MKVPKNKMTIGEEICVGDKITVWDKINVRDIMTVGDKMTTVDKIIVRDELLLGKIIQIKFKQDIVNSAHCWLKKCGPQTDHR